VRTFIAIDLDPAVKANLSGLVQRLKKSDPQGGVSWVREAGMHLTLKFLGEIEETKVGPVVAAMEEAARPATPFVLQVRGTGFFPNARFPRVLWVGISPSAALDSLQTRLEKLLASLGFDRESRPFHPHLTLGRVRSAAGLRGAITELDLQKNADFGTMTATKIALFQSVLRPAGAEHSVLKECPFA
jgi:2'-5' RNA ligase